MSARSDELRWYARLRDALQQMLGVGPDRQTEALYERCVAGLVPSAPAFVGRALPLAKVAAWLGIAIGVAVPTTTATSLSLSRSIFCSSVNFE